ncbi:MAG: DUF1906 domain-containing protein [Anaerolineales bacterium]|nr:DUF1906 domain-containing protein [Anaerolineales bacterium]
MKKYSLLLMIALAAWAVWPSTAAKATTSSPENIESFGTLSPQTGWVLMGQQVYWTENAGAVWHEVALPETGGAKIAAASFIAAERGWLVLITANEVTQPTYTLAYTKNGGGAWELTPLELFSAGDPAAYAENVHLQFQDAQRGWLNIKRATSSNFNLQSNFYTEDGGATWKVTDEAPSVALDWNLEQSGRCEGGVCELETRLRQSESGANISLPRGAEGVRRTLLAAKSSNVPEAPASSHQRWVTLVGQAFDSCTMPTAEQMQDWWTNSPYGTWNLYIGGSARANCGTLTADYIARLAVQGWWFIPTWVGPQAACSGFSSRMSSNPATAYTQGKTEADLAMNRAAELGLTFSNKSGTIIYYDLEAYFPPAGDTTCREAAKSFINGWTEQLRANGNQAGVYGTPCTSYLSDFVSITNVPDAAWIAAWYLDSYDPTATVWLGSSAVCLSNSLWVSGQRLRQYAGGHNETWGATTINIDSNVMDGRVADIRDSTSITQAVQLYRNADFVDATLCVATQAGWLNLSSCGADWNDAVSSLKIKPGWSVRVHRDTNLTGPSKCYILSDPDLTNDKLSNNGAVNDQISSLKVMNNTWCHDQFLYLPLMSR